MSVTSGSDDYRMIYRRRNRGKIWFDTPQHGFTFNLIERLPRMNLGNSRSDNWHLQCGCKRRLNVMGLGRQRREIEFYSVINILCPELTTKAGGESDPIPLKSQVGSQHMRRGQCCMTAKLYLGPGCKPPELVLARSCAHKKGGFRKIVLGRNGEQRLIREPVIQGHDSRRVASERGSSKGINDVKR